MQTVTETVSSYGYGRARNKYFNAGPATAVAGVSAEVNWVIEKSQDTVSRQIGRLYPGTAKTFVGVGEVIGPSESYLNAPTASLTGTVASASPNVDAVALYGIANATASNANVWGSNLIVTNEAGVSGVKLTGLEIDVEPSLGTEISANSVGLGIIGFNLEMPISAISIGGVGGGTFKYGMTVGGTNSDSIGIVPNGGQAMKALIDTDGGSYYLAAIALGNTNRLLFKGTSTTPAQMYNDTSNILRIIGGSGIFPITFRDNADVNTLVGIKNDGNLKLEVGRIGFIGAQTITTASAGSATLPSNPVTFLKVEVDEVIYKIPLYN